MVIERGETRSLAAWLVSQERVLRLWIEEVCAECTSDDDFVRKLEQHRTWLTERIGELRRDAA